jgi:hypothetical protein
MAQETQGEKIICPLCGGATAETSCPKCHEDLTLLHEARSRAIKCYNLGLELAKGKSKDDLRHTEECLNLAIMMDAKFVEPYIMLGKLCAQNRRYSEAISHWKKALSLDENNTDVEECLRGLKSLFEGLDTLRIEASWQGKPVRLGSEIRDSKGRRFMIWRLVPDDKNQDLTHIVVWMNSFFPEDRMIPVALISRVNDGIITIGEDLNDLLPRLKKYRPGTIDINNGLLSD